MRVLKVPLLPWAKVCVLFYNETNIMDSAVAEWGITSHGIFKHWFAYCDPVSTQFGRTDSTSWIKVIESKCIRCKKEIPPGVELALRLYK